MIISVINHTTGQLSDEEVQFAELWTAISRSGAEHEGKSFSQKNVQELSDHPTERRRARHL